MVGYTRALGYLFMQLDSVSFKSLGQDCRHQFFFCKYGIGRKLISEICSQRVLEFFSAVNKATKTQMQLCCFCTDCEGLLSLSIGEFDKNKNVRLQPP